MVSKRGTTPLRIPVPHPDFHPVPSEVRQKVQGGLLAKTPSRPLRPNAAELLGSALTEDFWRALRVFEFLRVWGFGFGMGSGLAQCLGTLGIVEVW